MTGYLLSNGLCVACGSNANACSTTTYALTCSTVSTGVGLSYYLSNGACVACGAGASACSSTVQATSCGTGYVLLTGATSCT